MFPPITRVLSLYCLPNRDLTHQHRQGPGKITKHSNQFQPNSCNIYIFVTLSHVLWFLLVIVVSGWTEHSLPLMSLEHLIFKYFFSLPGGMHIGQRPLLGHYLQPLSNPTSQLSTVTLPGALCKRATELCVSCFLKDFL